MTFQTYTQSSWILQQGLRIISACCFYWRNELAYEEYVDAWREISHPSVRLLIEKIVGTLVIITANISTSVSCASDAYGSKAVIATKLLCQFPPWQNSILNIQLLEWLHSFLCLGNTNTRKILWKLNASFLRGFSKESSESASVSHSVVSDSLRPHRL